MRTLLVALLTMVMLVAPAGARGGPSSKPIDIYIVVPADAVTTVTPAESKQHIERVVGQPTDAPCLQRWSPWDTSTWWTCTMEGWFRHEIGKVFDYRITTVNVPAYTYVGRDVCGSYAGYGAWQYTIDYLKGIASFSKGARTFLYLMGGGGWAGHFAPTNRQVDHAGMVGDWGAMQMVGRPNACIPAWAEPSGGLSHEFVGMMGMYVDGGCYDDGLGCYLGDAMTSAEKAALLKYSGSWLRSP